MTLNKISKAFFINLDRRTDRLEHINKNLPFSAERFTAVDAKNLELNNEIKKIFGKNLQKFTKAEISCSLSHYKLWKNLTLDKDADNYLILEDDAVFKEGFTNFWNQVFSKHIPENYNLIYLGGCQPWNKPHYHKVLEKYNDYFFNIKRNDFFTKNDHFWHMNASSYVLSKTAASLLCQWVEQNGIDDALDNFMQRFFNKNKLFASPKSIYHLNPLMSYQLHEENDNIEIDKKSDLRFAEEKFIQKTEPLVKVDSTSIINGKSKLHASEHSRIWIKRYCAIGENFSVITLNHDYNFLAMQGSLYRKFFHSGHPGEIVDKPTRARTKGDVVIGNDVCIGDNVFISSGVEIGDGCYIGANSVVTKNMPAYSICAGTPCRFIKYRFKENIIDFLINLKWWNWSEDKIKNNKDFFYCNLNTKSVSEIREMINE